MSQTQQDEKASAPLSPLSEDSATGLDNVAGTSNRYGSNSRTNTGSVSAESIIDFLDANPDVVVDLKALVAERLQARGTPMDANDISDDQLYQQIQTNPALRANVATFLHARGYTIDSGVAETSLPSVSSSAMSPRSGSGSAGENSLVERDSESRGASGRYSQADADRSVRARTVPLDGANRNDATHSSTDAPKTLRRLTPYNLQSMRDLYAQIPNQSTPLKRFGSDVFTDRRFGAAKQLSVTDAEDVPLDQDYVLGPGDVVEIDLWGAASQRLTRSIGMDGRVLLPDAGSIALAGISLSHAREMIEHAFAQQYRNVQVAVTLTHLRSVHVYVVGDVQRPGSYEISALATAVTALYAAGGPTTAGSLRIARHLRAGRLLEEVDLYEFLLKGLRNGSARFESGDTLLVPPAGLQVAVSGDVRRPAVYELKAGENTLDVLLENAGGLLPSASLDHVVIERIQGPGQESSRDGFTHGTDPQRITLTLALAPSGGEHSSRDALHAFAVKDGDRIRIEPILPYSERAIYLEGHVVRPGRMAFRDGLRLSDVLTSYRDLLPEPADRGEIVRLLAPDLHAETIPFNIPDVLIGNANLNLQPFDTVRVLSRYEADAPRVSIRGEVLHPGIYPLSTGMTAAQLVRMAGGFKRDALLENADLTSYSIRNGQRIEASVATVPIGEVVSGSKSQMDVGLKPGDVLAIHQISGWNDIGQSVTLEGQVRYPGVYGFTDGERLSSVLRRAGGLLPSAYPTGAVLVREQVREVELQSRAELIRQIKTNAAAARLSPTLEAGDMAASMQLIKSQQEQVIADLESHPPSGRMVIHIDSEIDTWAATPEDIELRRGDVLTVPRQPGFVAVTGQVYNATALAYTPDKTAAWYLSHAGGANSTSDRKQIFIVRANGSVVGRRSGGHFGGDVLSTKLNPGDVVVVPQKIVGRSQLWRNLLSTAQIASSIAITASVASL